MARWTDGKNWAVWVIYDPCQSISRWFIVLFTKCIVWPICQLNFQLMEFNMLKLSQKLKLLSQLNKKTWISLHFTPLEYSFYILQLLSIFCHFVHLKYLWHFTLRVFFFIFYASRVFFDILHPRSIFWLWSNGVSPSWVRQRKDEKRSVPYNVEKSIYNFQLVANCSLCITCSVCAMG